MFSRNNFYLLTIHFYLRFMPSSVVAAIKYNADSSTLRVIYVSGMVYDYKNVPEEVWLAMKTSFSKGIFLNKNIKGKYEFEKIRKGK